MYRFIFAGVAASILSACGGGGGGSADVPAAAAATFNMDAAIASVLGAGFSASNLRASDAAGNNYVLSYAYSPAADGNFLGKTYKQAIQTTTVSRNGGAAAAASGTVFYTTNPTRLVSTINSQGYVSIHEPKTNLPTAGTVGQSGVYSSGNTYVSTSINVVLSTNTVVWSLESDTAATAFACMTTTTNLSVGGSTLQKECYRISPAGQVSGAKITTVASGVTLAFQ